MSEQNIYLSLTAEFNAGRLRTIISSGQAVVLHKIAIMSKDGDWIIREDAEAVSRVLGILEKHGARYRFGAPLDIRWLSGGWSSHFEFSENGMRVRTDFVSRPPRIPQNDLLSIWKEQETINPPCIDIRRLADLKKTNREKDYAVIGELARRMHDPEDQFLYSRSARDLAALAERFPDRAKSLAGRRPLLDMIPAGLEPLEAALDAERRALMHENERRLLAYQNSAERWAGEWPALEKRIAQLPLIKAHHVIVKAAEDILPFDPCAGESV